MTRRLALLVSTAVVLVVSSARAEPAAGKRAERLFKEGSDALAQSRYDEACPKLEESNRLEPALGTEYNLAVCLELSHRPAAARKLYKHVVQLATKAGKLTLVKEATDRASKLDATVPRLVMRVPANVKASTVKLDGEPIEPESLATVWELEPGSHTIVITAEGQEPFEKKVEAREGRTLEVTATFTPVRTAAPQAPSAPAPQPRAQTASEPFPWKWVGLGAAGVGVLGLGAGGYFALSAKNARDESGCRDDGHCSSEAAANRLRDAKSSADLSTVFVIAGATLVTAGLVVFFVAPGTDGKRAVEAAVALSPTGVALRGTWF
jgi:tetratricopeptide (TPR) repeat protein